MNASVFAGPWGSRAKALLLAVQAAVAIWLAFAWLPSRAAWINGGVLFGAYVVLFGWGAALAGVWVRGNLRGVSWGVAVFGALVPYLFVHGAEVSAEALVNFGAIPYFSVATLLWAALAARETASSERRALPDWVFALALAACALALMAGVWAMRGWMQTTLMWSEDRTSIYLLLMRRFNGAATDIGGDVFRQQAWLPVAALWGGALGALLVWRRRLSESRFLWSLFGLALLGKLALAGLTTQGLSVIALKISSINTNYLNIAKLVDELGLFQFLREYGSRQAQIGFHGDTHPPLAVLIYWVLGKLSFGNLYLVALGIMAASASALWPFYHLVRRLGGPDAGAAAAALFISSPMSLILGNAGIDSVVLSGVAFSAWGLLVSLQDRRLGLAVAAGVSLGLAANCSFGANNALVFLGTWGLLLQWRRDREPASFLTGALLTWTLFSLGMLAVHGAVWAASGGHFSYMGSMRTAQFVHSSVNQYRVYELWSWANVVLYSGYAGAGLLVLWIAALIRGLFTADTRDLTVYVAAAFVLTAVLAAYGRAEVQRQFLFGVAFLVPGAALLLSRGGRGQRHLPLLVALGLNVLNAVLLQINVLDYW